MHRDELARRLDDLLQPNRFRDYCPNGLQLEGRDEVRRIATSVTASLAALRAAVEWRADALLVHHGWFWRGEDGRIVGTRRERIALALDAGLNLFAYHLPLDALAEMGNNAQLARRLGLNEEGRCGEQDLVCHGRPARPCTLLELEAIISLALTRQPLVVTSDGYESGRTLRRIAWCTGGAQGFFEEAIRLGVDAYLTGEISEPQFHLARESGVAFIAAGHHATERFGVQALGEHLARSCGLEHRYLEIENPV